MVKSKSSIKTNQKQVKNSGKDEQKKQRKTIITADTKYGKCSERLTAFGGLLALIKLLDLLDFEKEFEKHYAHSNRETKLGDYRMVLGILMLLFIGFQRLGHFVYIRTDAMVCGFLRVRVLPAVSTFWRYLSSLGHVQSDSVLMLSAALRKRVWALCNYAPKRVSIDIDTTVVTVYGNTEGACKGHNPKHRGKKGLRPVMLFLDNKEYICGKQRHGSTIKCKEVASQIKNIPKLLPRSVRDVHVRGDGEFIGWDTIKACLEEGFTYTFANKSCSPQFSEETWYTHGGYEYNECFYQPQGWDKPCRFVVMRIRKDQINDRQLKLFETETYTYRVFVTNTTSRPHQVISDYDLRAGAENLIGEAQREGVLAVPSKRFESHHVFFQIVMFAYNLWRWMNMLARHYETQKQQGMDANKSLEIKMPYNTIHVSRLKLLYVSAKIITHANLDEVRYSIHEQRAAGLCDFMNYLDLRRKEVHNVA